MDNAVFRTPAVSFDTVLHGSICFAQMSLKLQSKYIKYRHMLQSKDKILKKYFLGTTRIVNINVFKHTREFVVPRDKELIANRQYV